MIASTPAIDEPVEGFEIDDLFLSRTDERGVILSGNTVFQRLSGYDWQTLIGAPHKIIRHPDIPKAVFRMLWKTLQEGQPFGGYVKNKASSGRYYWVFAVATPVKDGYLSVRLKPSTELLDTVAQLYASLLEAERSGQDPDEGVVAIEDAVKSLGFRDYHAFMGYALGAELTARQTSMQRPVDPSIAQFEQIGNLLIGLGKEVAHVRDQFKNISGSPANLNILGSRLSTNREPVQVVAQNYSMLSDELFLQIETLAGRMDDLLDTAYLGRMGHCAGLLYQEAIQAYIDNEPHAGTRGYRQEVDVLRSVLHDFLADADSGCRSIGTEVSRFIELTSRLRRMLSGLAMTRIVCRIESASVREDTSSIDEITARLSEFQEELGASLDRISDACKQMVDHVPTTIKQGHAVERMAANC